MITDIKIKEKKNKNINLNNNNNDINIYTLKNNWIVNQINKIIIMILIFIL